MKKIFVLFFLFLNFNSIAQLKKVYSIAPDLKTSYGDATLINDKFYLSGDDNSINGLGNELFISDTTTSGTMLLKNINTKLYSSSEPDKFIRLNNKQVVFIANDELYGKELWITDGTKAGTNLLLDITPGSDCFAYEYFINVGNQVYFMANDVTNGYELWKTDGTDSGTKMIKNVNPKGDGMGMKSTVFVFSYYGKAIIKMGNFVYFVANDGSTGYELWKTDGTDQGTSLVKDIYEGSKSSTPTSFVVIGNTLYFGATTLKNGTELWKSDGTEEGTVIVKDIGQAYSGSDPNYLVSLNSKVYFSGLLSSKATFFESDGTLDGTKPIFTSANFNTIISRLTKVDSLIYFFESNTFAPAIYTLFKFDAITNTVTMVKDKLFEGTTGAGYQPTKEMSVALNGMLYFTFDNFTNGDELWQSDGTAVGTKMITDIAVGKATSWIVNLTPVKNGANSRLYFTTSSKKGLLYILSDSVNNTLGGINEVAKNLKNNFIIYPNPAQNVLNISLVLQNNQPVTIQISNTIGEQILTQIFNQTNISINISSLKKGIYAVSIRNNGIESTQKLSIQ